MAVQFDCTSCGRRFRIKEQFRATRLRCPNCKTEAVVSGLHVQGYDVFVSYSSKDKQVADAVVAALESKSLRCWIAPRDIDPGAAWGAAIIEGIEDSRVMVLLFSAHSNASDQVLREVERAVAKKVPVLPFRLDDAPMSKSFEYFLGTCHWLTTTEGRIDKHLGQLTSTVRQLLLERVEQAAGTPGNAPELDEAVTGIEFAGRPHQHRKTRLLEYLRPHGRLGLGIAIAIAVTSTAIMLVARSTQNKAGADGPRDPASPVATNVPAKRPVATPSTVPSAPATVPSGPPPDAVPQAAPVTTRASPPPVPRATPSPDQAATAGAPASDNTIEKERGATATVMGEPTPGAVAQAPVIVRNPAAALVPVGSSWVAMEGSNAKGATIHSAEGSSVALDVMSGNGAVWRYTMNMTTDGKLTVVQEDPVHVPKNAPPHTDPHIEGYVTSTQLVLKGTHRRGAHLHDFILNCKRQD